jgi:putative hydrolase
VRRATEGAKGAALYYRNGMSQFPFGFGAADSNEPGRFDMNNLGAMFTQFGQMLQQSQNEGPLPWTTVMQVARAGLGTDPSVSEASVRAVESAMELADLWLNDSVSFPASSTKVKAWSRSEWIVETGPVWQIIILPIATTMSARMEAMLPELTGTEDSSAIQDQLPEQLKALLPDGVTPEMMAMLKPMMGMVTQIGASAFAYQLGQALSALAKEVVSSTDVGIPLAPVGIRALIPMNISEFSTGLGIDERDLFLFFALRESAHQRLFDHAPWLRPRLMSAVEEYARYMDVDIASMGEKFDGFDLSNPEALQEIMASGVIEPEDTAEQRAAILRLETLLALIEGWVDEVVSQAAGERLASLAQLRETMGRRRATGGPAETTFSTLVGMKLRPTLFREANTVFAAVRAKSGIEARDALWNHPDLLPDAESLADPLGFAESVTGGSAFDDISMSDFETDEEQG